MDIRPSSDEWKDFVQQCNILDIEQSHDTVDDTFPNGHHAGERVESLKRKLLSREVDPLQIIALVVARVPSKIFVVFGNRRLKALKEACFEGMAKQDVNYIVHDLTKKFLEISLEFNKNH